MNRTLFCLFFNIVLFATGNLSAQIVFFTIANGDVTALKNALNSSNTDGLDDIISLATNGTYTLSAVDNVTNGANGLPVIGTDGNHSVTIHGHGSTITRSGSTPFRILQCAASSRVLIDNLTISNGLIDLFGPGSVAGAGIFINGGALTVTTCTFNSNSVHGQNGGDGISGEPNGNAGDNAAGGAIGSSGGALTATGCTFNNNSAVGGKGGNGLSGAGGGKGGNGGAGHGGAIEIFSASPATIDSCAFTNNSATGGNGGDASNNNGTGATGTGGAIYAAATTITRSVFNSNSVTAGQNGAPGNFVVAESFGGALDVIGTVAESTFTNNSAQHGGGLVANYGGFSVTVTGCLFQNNSASIEGGAIYVGLVFNGFGYDLGVLSMSNCTISGDSAPDGAAILNRGTASLVNCTVVGNNSSTSGAGNVEKYSPGNTVSLTNSILKTGTSGANVGSNSITSHGHNISNDNAAGLLTAAGDMPNTDPLLTSDTPGDYGGPTKTIAIGVFGSSPAIDAGDDALAPSRDQRGYARNGVSDIGAFEKGGTLTPLSAVSRKNHGTSDFDINLPLTGTIGVECRRNTGADTSGANAGHDHQVIVTFPFPVSIDSATADHSVTADPLPTGQNQTYTLNLHGVPNAQIITLTLNNVRDNTNTFTDTIPMGMLLGDVNGSGRVDSGDVSLVRQQTLQTLTTSNFPEDVNVSGRIDSGDVSIVRQQTLTSLP